MSLAPATAAQCSPTSADEPVKAAVRPGPHAVLDAPAIVRLLQFVLEADTADTVLHRATATLGLLAEIEWAEIDGKDDADLVATFADHGVTHRIDVALADPANAAVRAGVQALLMLVVQIHGRVAELERLRAEAITDPLTGLWNRRGFEPLLDQALARAARTGEAIAVVLIDVDRFKSINDELGHAVGDFALVAVAAALGSGIRPTDVAARIGGDEFALLLSGAEAQGAVLVCERIRRALVRANPLTNRAVTLSFGIADIASLRGSTPGPFARATWLAAADSALYEAKARGRDGITCHDEAGVVDEDTTRPICLRAA